MLGTFIDFVYYWFTNTDIIGKKTTDLNRLVHSVFSEVSDWMWFIVYVNDICWHRFLNRWNNFFGKKK